MQGAINGMGWRKISVSAACSSCCGPRPIPERRPRVPTARLLITLTLLNFSAQSAEAAVPRNVPTVGTVITVRGDENNVYFVDTLDWRKAEIDQALATGDALRTGPLGGLAILFLDQTQIRVHRNTLLEIRYVGTEAEPGKSAFKLEQGAVWSRVRRGLGSRGVTFETPAATAAIRGTDWYLSVDADKSTLVVLDGSVEFFNEFGSLQVTSGEIATAVVGQAPTKRILVAPKDQPRWVLDLSLEWFNILSLTGLPMGTLLSAKPDPADPLGWVEGLCDLGD